MNPILGVVLTVGPSARLRRGVGFRRRTPSGVVESPGISGDLGHLWTRNSTHRRCRGGRLGHCLRPTSHACRLSSSWLIRCAWHGSRREGLPSEDEEEEKKEGEEEKGEAAQSAPTPVDQATVRAMARVLVSKISSMSTVQARQRAARAAISRQAGASVIMPRAPAAPGAIAPGRDEGSSTRAAGASAGDAAAAGGGASVEQRAEGVDEEGLSELAGAAGARLLVAAGVTTVALLADRDEEELARELGELQGRRREGGAAGGGGEAEGEVVEISEEVVSGWVEEARGEELDEVMAELVGGDEDLVEVRGVPNLDGAFFSFFFFFAAWRV